MDLASYLEWKNENATEFARKIGVNSSTVARYVHGDRFPSPSAMLRIKEETKGLVTANDFVDAYERKRKKGLLDEVLSD